MGVVAQRTKDKGLAAKWMHNKPRIDLRRGAHTRLLQVTCPLARVLAPFTMCRPVLMHSPEFSFVFFGDPGLLPSRAEPYGRQKI